MTKKSNPPKAEQTQALPEDANPGKPQKRTLFGKFLSFIFEATFVLTILIFGTLIGVVIGVILPLGFPFLILYKRYVQGQGRGEAHAEA